MLLHHLLRVRNYKSQQQCGRDAAACGSRGIGSRSVEASSARAGKPALRILRSVIRLARSFEQRLRMEAAAFRACGDRPSSEGGGFRGGRSLTCSDSTKGVGVARAKGLERSGPLYCGMDFADVRGDRVVLVWYDEAGNITDECWKVLNA